MLRCRNRGTISLALDRNECIPILHGEHQPETHAPLTGHDEELNIFGTPTGKVEHVREGERLPHAPRGFSWRRMEEESH